MPWQPTAPVTSWLFAGFLVTFAVWLSLSAFVMIDRARFERRRRALTAIGEEVAGTETGPQAGTDAGSGSALATRPTVTRILDQLSRRAVYRLVADIDMPPWVAAICAAYALRRWGLEDMVRDASSHRGRGKWRRIAALFALERIHFDGVHALLERAIADGDRDVAGAAVIALHRVGDRHAAEILATALRARSYPPSRIATQLDQFPIPIDDVLQPLLSDPRAHARYWAASLLRRYGAKPDLGSALAALVNDPDGPVRKAALESLADVDPTAAVPAATERLSDPIDFVRSAAVRSLARVAGADPDARHACARTIVPLLADPVFEVRSATKDALALLGPAIWPEVAAGLDSPDGFARNSAAEVLQNLGLIDTVIDELARNRTPSAALVRIVERVFEEGGPGMVDAAVARSTPQLVSSASELFVRLGIAM